MNIETQYNINSTVYFMHNNKVWEGTVKKITITAENNRLIITYKVQYNDWKYKSLKESQAYNTKQELLNSL
jgi:hypothetical protein